MSVFELIAVLDFVLRLFSFVYTIGKDFLKYKNNRPVPDKD